MKCFAAVWLFSATALFAQNVQVLTLDEAITIGRRNSRTLGITAARASADQARAAEAGAQLYPGVALYGSYTRIKEGEFRLTPRNLPMTISIGNVPPDQVILRLGLRQPLFTGSRISGAAEAAGLQADASALDVSMMSADVTLYITSAYWALYQARQVEKYTEENVQRLESFHRDTERLVKAGVATRNDLLKVEVQLSNSRIGWIEARNEAELGEMTLNNLIGQPTDTHIDLASRPGDAASRVSVLPPLAQASPDTLANLATAHRYDLQAAAARVQAAHASVGAAKGGWWPQIELTANLNYNNPNARYQPVTPEFLGAWDVGVSLALDVWNWGATGSRVEQAEAALRQAELQKTQLKENITLEVRRSALNVRRSQEKSSLAELAVSQATENLRVIADKYRSGLATSTDLLDAEVSLLQAQTQFSGAQVEYALAQASLERALGGLESSVRKAG
jgi:outer membrane protein